MRFIHCADGWLGEGESDKERIKRAMSSWTGVNWVETKFRPRRDSTVLGSQRKLCFVRDVLAAGLELVQDWDKDVLVLTNSDSGLVSDFVAQVLDTYSEFRREAADPPLLYSHRRDWPKAVRGQLTAGQNCTMGNYSSGIDCFVMPAYWVKEWMAIGAGEVGHMPDLVLGCEGWDWVFKFTIRESGGAVRDDLIWHELHGVPQWQNQLIGGRTQEAANVLNRVLCYRWWSMLPEQWKGPDSWKGLIWHLWPALSEYQKHDSESVLRDARLAGLHV